MRIALICPYHIFRGGGVQEIVKALQSEYEKRGHYVKILTPMPSGYDGDVPPSVITLGTSRSTTAFGGTAWQFSLYPGPDEIDEVFAREKFDLLHFHEPWIPFWSRQLLQRSSCATVGTMHGRFIDTMTAKTLNTVITPYIRSMIKNFDVFSGVSEAATEYFRSVSHRPVVIVPNGIDVAKYQAYEPPAKSTTKKEKTILYIGRLEGRKGLKYLIRAYGLLCAKRSDIRLVIAGTGVDDKKLKDYVKDNDIPRVSFLGFISDEEKIKLLHQADLFCSAATYGESFGMVLLEAMVANCPIVAGDNAGYITTMRDTGAISLVNPKDTVDFARRLELMAFDENLRQIWRSWAKTHVPQFDWPKIADQYLDVYEQAIERHEQKNT